MNLHENVPGENCLDNSKLALGVFIEEHTKGHSWRKTCEEQKDNACQRLRSVLGFERVGPVADIPWGSALNIGTYPAGKRAGKSQGVITIVWFLMFVGCSGFSTFYHLLLRYRSSSRASKTWCGHHSARSQQRACDVKRGSRNIK